MRDNDVVYTLYVESEAVVKCQVKSLL